jgi:hypothetical protein
VFFGPLGAEGQSLIDYFEQTPNEKGEFPRIPEGMNPASWMLEVVGAGLAGALKRATHRKHAHGATAAAAPAGELAPGELPPEDKPFDYADVFERSDLFARQTAELQTVAHPAELVPFSMQLDEYVIPVWTQVRCVVTRGFVSYWRDSFMNFGRVMMLIFISLIFGIVYVQLDQSTYSGLTSKISSIFSFAGFLAMLSAQTTLPCIFGERAVYYRETSSNAYPSWIYSTTTGLCEIPYVFISSLLGCIIFYFMVRHTHACTNQTAHQAMRSRAVSRSESQFVVAHCRPSASVPCCALVSPLLPTFVQVGYEMDAALFFQFWCAISCLVLIESSFGQLAAAALPNFVVAIQLAGALNTLFFLFGGLFIRPYDIPVGWQWFYYLNPIPKAIIAIVLPQFECHPSSGLDPYALSSGCPAILDPQTGGAVTIHSYVQSQWMTSYDAVFGRMIGWLILTYAVFRLGIFLSFRYINHLKR